MSTKIYIAWRCRASGLNDALDSFRAAAFVSAAKVAKEVTRAMGGVTHKNVKEFLVKCEGNSSQSIRQQPDIDCSCNVWLHNSHAYIIPYTELPFLEWGKWLPYGCEDFCYYNNTDRPDDVTARQWKIREKTWDEVCVRDHDGRRLVHTVIDAASITGHGLYEVVQLIFPKCKNPWSLLP